MKKIISLLFLTIFSLLLAMGQDFPIRPNPPKLVNDFTGFLKQGEQDALEQKLVQFNNETSTQIAIVIIPSLNRFYPGSE